MEFLCKFCGQPFQSDWYPPDDEWDGNSCRFRSSLCDQCAVFWFVESTSYPRIFLSKKYKQHLNACRIENTRERIWQQGGRP